ncbi:MAG TPA: hypothetical protein VE973_01030 [Candidatus Limnocylindria bacterium]|nr:hypothetical protein [Candidatus Limnocylindria bacterium]
MKSIKAVLSAFFGFFFGSKAKVDPNKITGFAFTGSPSCWISRGESRLVYANEGFEFSAKVSDIEGVQSVEIKIESKDHSEYWTVDFAAPVHTALFGEFPYATRCGFQNEANAGLSFTSPGRCCNRISGYFTVLEMGVNNETLTCFAADFVQFDEMFQDQWNFGSIRYNSAAPCTTTLPLELQNVTSVE